MPSCELTLHTVSPQHTESASPLSLPRPFERVIGVTLPTERTIWKPSLEAEETDAAGITVRTFELPTACAVRTAMTFEQVVGSKSVLFGYNCHSFASFVAGDSPSPIAIRANRRAAHTIAEGHEGTYPLEVGQQGVIGYSDQKKRKLWRGRPLHSIIGLGREETYCLQVTNTWGHMALSTYDGILSLYRAGKAADKPKLYVQG